MADDWETVSLGDICTGIYDGPHATPPPSETGAVFLRIENITPSGRLDFSDIRRINDADWGRWTRRITPQSDDVVFSYEANLGLFARIPPGFHGCLGRRLALMRPDPLQVDAGYLLYACLAPEFQELLRQRTVLGSTVDRISLREFPTFEIPLPPLPEQKRIAHILGTLDDKIELNRRMNATLEGISRAIFKSWFVDFDPVRQKAVGKQPVGMDAQTAAMFPDSFEESEIGEVPKGWHTTTLGELCSRIAMGPFGSDIKTSNFVTEGVPVVRGGNLTCGFRDEDFVYLTEEKADDLKNANAFPDDIVITHRGTLGQVGLIPQKSRYRRYVVSQSQMLVSVNRQLTTPRFIYDYLVSPTGQHELLANTSQTGVPAISRPTASVRGIRLVAPLPALAIAYESITSPMHRRREALVRESRTLAALRDTLLPKLLSGEVRIAEAKEAVEEAIG